jgi:sodium transport system ATP-binding protein
MGAAAATAAPAAGAMLDMAPLLDRRTEGFSQGERMKTALARALVHDPSHIVLDEPTNGLDVLATRSLRDALRRLRDEHRQVHRLLQPHHAGGGAAVRPGGGGGHGRTVAEGTVPALLARTGHRDFEACFVQLAFGPAAAAGFGAPP